MNTLAPYLAHTGIKRDELGVYHLKMRTQEGANAIEDICRVKGLKVVIEVIPPPHYFKSKQELLDYWISTNEVFKEFHEKLGLEIIS